MVISVPFFVARHYKAVDPKAEFVPCFILQRMSGEQWNLNGNKFAAHTNFLKPARKPRRQQELIIPPAAVRGFDDMDGRQQFNILCPPGFGNGPRIVEDDRVSARRVCADRPKRFHWVKASTPNGICGGLDEGGTSCANALEVNKSRVEANTSTSILGQQSSFMLPDLDERPEITRSVVRHSSRP